jgi:exosome complex component MTR3
MEVGKTKVLATVFGPRPTTVQSFSDEASLNCTLRVATFSSAVGRREHAPDDEQKALSSQLRQALEVAVRLEAYPKSLIDVHALVLQDDGGALPVAIACASLALVDAGIECLDMVAAVTVGRLPCSRVVVDPCFAEERMLSSRITIAYMPSLNEIVQFLQHGELDAATLDVMTQLCLDACSQFVRIQIATLLEAHQQQQQQQEQQQAKVTASSSNKKQKTKSKKKRRSAGI